MTTTLGNIKPFYKSSRQVWEQAQSFRQYFNASSKERAALGQSVQGVHERTRLCLVLREGRVLNNEEAA